MQIYSLKDLLLSQEQINSFDRALDMKESIDADKIESRANLEFSANKIEFEKK
jgi:hypothetical protein